MNWILIFISGLITYLLRFSMISIIKKEMLSKKTRTLLGYVPSAVFPALIFPAIFLDSSGSFESIDNPKIYGALAAVLVGYLTRNIIYTILSGLSFYWFYIYVL